MTHTSARVRIVILEPGKGLNCILDVQEFALGMTPRKAFLDAVKDNSDPAKGIEVEVWLIKGDQSDQFGTIQIATPAGCRKPRPCIIDGQATTGATDAQRAIDPLKFWDVLATL